MQTEQQAYRCGSIALLGRPNAGKSTLMNHLIGAKVAIVTPKPQTTRHRILGIDTNPQRQMIFVDTPGIHRGRQQLNKRMVKAAFAAAQEADVLLIIQDVTKPLDRHVKEMIGQFTESLSYKPRIHVLNKVDKINKRDLLPRLMQTQQLDPKANAFIPVSALRGVQIEELMQSLEKVLPEAEAMYDADWYTDQNQRQLVAEYVREQVFMGMHEEVPFQTAVDIEAFEELPDGVRVSAVIWVGSERHKPMLIGRGGEGLKGIGMRARKGLAELFQTKVHLDLWVKVREGWYDHPGRLSELGLHDC